MKKALFLTLLALSFFLLTSSASAVEFAVGGFGGVNIPILQDDEDNGTLFGAKVKVIPLPFLAVEPNFTYFKNGDVSIEIDEERGINMDREGGKINSIGVDLVLGSMHPANKFTFYAIFGLSSNTLKKQGLEDQTQLGLAFGTGFEIFPADKFGVEVRAKLNAIKLDSDASRKNLGIYGGVNYYFDFKQK